jgi:hypothetical protein
VPATFNLLHAAWGKTPQLGYNIQSLQ